MSAVRPKPEGSKIEELNVSDGVCYRWSPPSGGLLRYLIGAFLLFWLCGWLFGFVSAIGILIAPEGAEAEGGAAPRLFIAAWLAIWSLGGAFAIYFAYRLLRPMEPESITLAADCFQHDSGSPTPLVMMNPWFMRGHTDPFEAFRKFFGKRRVVDVAKTELGPVVLEQSGGRQRLYYDQGADRIEIAEYLREPEREWLAEVIADWQADPE